MSQDHRQSSLVERIESLAASRLSRRRLLLRSAAAGASLPVVASLLAACAEDDTEDDSDSDEEDTDAAAEAEDDEEDEATPVPEEDEGTEEEVEETEEEEQTEESDEAEEDEGDGEGEGEYGGELQVALVGEPPSLDIMSGTQAIMRFMMPHAVEFLFTWDEDFAVVPELVDSHDVSDDGLTNTIQLRQGVPFHNGDELTADDVIASIEQWAEISSLGATWMDSVDEIEQVDDYTVDFHMNNPLGTFAPMLARLGAGCAIYPADIVEGAGAAGVEEIVSTGPYVLTEHQPDAHILFERFEDYAAREEPSSGYGGRKYAYVDSIRFVPVPDQAARISGLQAGDYHFLEEVSPDQVEAFEEDENIVAAPEPYNWATFVFNTREGIMTNQTLRQAAQAALNHEEVLQAGYGEGYFRIDPSLMLQETAWHSTAGEELYNRNDPETAAQLLEEAGYEGETIRFLTTQEYRDHYNNSVVGAQQLEDAGFSIELEFYDWATVGERRADPELWDIFTTGISGVDPALLAPIATTEWPGWWSTDSKVELVSQLQQETAFEDRYEVFEQLQELFYEEAALIKLGDAMRISARLASVQNFVPIIQLSAFLWNVWLDE